MFLNRCAPAQTSRHVPFLPIKVSWQIKSAPPLDNDLVFRFNSGFLVLRRTWLLALSRNHHFIPQCYLRMFAQGKGKKSKIYCCDLLDGKTYTTLVRNVGARRDFNKIEAEGQSPDALETAYSKFETPLSEALRRIDARQNIEDFEDLVYVLNLMALMATRHPRNRSSISQFLEQVYRVQAQNLTASKQRYENAFRNAEAMGHITKSSADVSYERARDFVEKGNYSIEVHQNMLIELELEGMNDVLDTMALRKWSLLIASDQSGYFVTSDNPVCLIPVRPLKAPFTSVGHGMSDTSVLFPLSKHLVLVGLYVIASPFPIRKMVKLNLEPAYTVIQKSVAREVV